MQENFFIIQMRYKECLLYLNFEDERLIPFDIGDFQQILEAYYRKFPHLKDQLCYLYLDEVQRIQGWKLDFCSRFCIKATQLMCKRD